MVTKFAATPVRLAFTLGVCALSVGCGAIQKPELTREPVPETRVENRFSGSDDDNGYTTSVPRTDYSSEIRSNAPTQHIVVRGDTLWDIAGKFLKSPWLWPKIWDKNPAIKDPHLIYPGDRIALDYVGGQPRLVVASRDGNQVSAPVAGAFAVNANTGDAERLSPRIRVEDLETAIPTIPADAVQQFLVHPRVVTKKEWNAAPYIVGNYEGRLTSAVGHQIYARGDFSSVKPTYGVFRKSKPLKDPITGELLGHEVIHVSDVKTLHVDDPATLVIQSNRLETMNGDRLLPRSTAGANYNYIPRMPKMDGEGRIISLINAITQSGRNQIVVLNLGKRSGVEVGDIMAIERRGGTFLDRRGRGGYEHVDLPSTRTGVLMVFQTFAKVSYALVMESTRPIHIQDVVTDI